MLHGSQTTFGLLFCGCTQQDSPRQNYLSFVPLKNYTKQQFVKMWVCITKWFAMNK